jgi:hypothetical protein
MSAYGSGSSELVVVGCTLDQPGLGAQLARYRQLGQHATSVERRPGEVLVRFTDDLPPGLLEHTLDVERRCCSFVHANYDAEDRLLTITVETVDQAPRLDSFVAALTKAPSPTS